MLEFILAVLIITIFVSLFFRKKYNIAAEFRRYRQVNNTQKWIEWTLFILFIIVEIIAVFVLSYREIYVLMFGFAMILYGFRTLMEYKYDREKKAYIINLVFAIGYCVSFIGCICFTLYN